MNPPLPKAITDFLERRIELLCKPLVNNFVFGFGFGFYFVSYRRMIKQSSLHNNAYMLQVLSIIGFILISLHTRKKKKKKKKRAPRFGGE